MADLPELFGPAWPQAFWDWQRSELERTPPSEFEVIEAGWKPFGFHAKVMLNRRETFFTYQPTEWDCEVRERELASHGV